MINSFCSPKASIVVNNSQRIDAAYERGVACELSWRGGRGAGVVDSQVPRHRRIEVRKVGRNIDERQRLQRQTSGEVDRDGCDLPRWNRSS